MKNQQTEFWHWSFLSQDVHGAGLGWSVWHPLPLPHACRQTEAGPKGALSV